MLVVAPLPGKEAAGSRGQDEQASNSSQQSSNDGPTSGSVVHMSSASSTEEIVAKLKYVIRTRPRNQSATEKSSLFDKVRTFTEPCLHAEAWLVKVPIKIEFVYTSSQSSSFALSLDARQEELCSV